jgi:hypothetical protein
MRIKHETSGDLKAISPSNNRKNLQHRYMILTHLSLGKDVTIAG